MHDSLDGDYGDWIVFQPCIQGFDRLCLLVGSFKQKVYELNRHMPSNVLLYVFVVQQFIKPRPRAVPVNPFRQDRVWIVHSATKTCNHVARSRRTLFDVTGHCEPVVI
jgi:hypothetical protein